MRLILLVLVGALCAATSMADIKRTASGNPDLSGYYDGGSLTPRNRPAAFGEQRWMTAEQATSIQTLEGPIDDGRSNDPNRGAPQKGGDGNNAAGAGNVGGYNAVWVDPGKGVLPIDGRFATSIVYDPPNGRTPPMTAKARASMVKNAASFIHDNDGTASWLDHDGPGPFDGPETLAIAERCLLGFTPGVPMLPSLYNNHKRIVQGEDYVMILIEMVHDARIIRMNAEHAPDGMRRWLGDSIGRWEGDTLVVETKNFRERTSLGGADENLHVVERFSLKEDGNLLYDFTVDDPTAWEAPWSGQYMLKATEEPVYEYACHEGNYAMGNILRGARRLEREYVSGGGGND